MTFDDGPSPQTLHVLSVLKANNIKAAFFILGSNLQDPIYRSYLQQIASDGHLICSHGWSHTSVTTLDNNRILQEISDIANAIKQATGVTPEYFRPPYGSINNDKNAYIRSLGYKIINWNVDSVD